MSSGLDWERVGMITGGDEVCTLPPPTLSEKGVGIPTFVHFPIIFESERSQIAQVTRKKQSGNVQQYIFCGIGIISSGVQVRVGTSTVL